MSWDIQRRDAENAENAEGRGEEDRPDLELERLVMGDEAREDRPAAGWLVREDVVRGAVERIKELTKRLDLSETEHKITEKALQGGAGMIVALKERNDQAREALARSEMEAAELRKQVEEEERMVKRLREVVLGAPRAVVINGAFSDCPRPMVAEDVQFAIGDQVALVRLTPDGLGLAGEKEDDE